MCRIKMLQQPNQLGTVDKWAQDEHYKALCFSSGQRVKEKVLCDVYINISTGPLQQQDHGKTSISKSCISDANVKPICFVHQ